MTILIEEASGSAREEFIPLLLLAEPSERALRWGLAHISDAVYRMREDGVTVGAVSVRWRDDPCEIEELAIAPEQQGRKLGQHLIEWVVAEARRRKKQAVLVGASNSRVGNIAFYQKCGFRMDHVRKDYFRYYRPPIVENGLEVRDLLMLRRDL